MRSIVFIRSYTLVLCFTLFYADVFAQQNQEKPLTQPELVQLVYQMQKNPGKRDEIVETIRRRGLGFELTSGVRGLVATKTGSDPLIKRTLEEAERRRTNPTASQLPPEAESLELIEKARAATLAAVEEMPDFVVKQLVRRSYAYAGTNNFKQADRLTVAVSYRAEGGEEYRILSLNGALQDTAKQGRSYEQAGGTTSAGEFVTVLANIFKETSKTEFQPVDTDVVRARRAIVYNFDVKRENSTQTITAQGLTRESTVSGVRGKLWIDRENARVLRVESVATEIPAAFPVTAASRNVDYEWVAIGDAQYLLPSLSDVRLTSRQDRNLIESRNEIRFRDYQKYGTEVRIIEEEEIVEDEKPKP